MCNEAAILVDRVLPNAPIRHWVLSLPFELRGLAATKPDVPPVRGGARPATDILLDMPERSYESVMSRKVALLLVFLGASACAPLRLPPEEALSTKFMPLHPRGACQGLPLRDPDMTIEASYGIDKDYCATHGKSGCPRLAMWSLCGYPFAKDDEDAAWQRLSRACTAGADVKACELLGLALMVGWKTEANPTRGYAYLQWACERSSTSACVSRDRALWNGTGVAADRRRAADDLDAQCKRDLSACPSASFAARLLGAPRSSPLCWTITSAGEVEPMSQPIDCLRWLCRSVESIDRSWLGPPPGEACTWLGELTQQGLGEGPDARRALKLFAEGCRHGDPLGCRRAAYSWLEGRGGVQASESEARALLKRACERGDPVSCRLQ